MSEEMDKSFQQAQHAGYDQITDINKRLIFNMRDLNHIMRFLYEGKASQKRILIVLNEVKSITQRDLTMRLGIQPGSASEILSKLENAGLILRTISETDRRTANISLTARGVQAAHEAAKQRSKRHLEMFSCLSESEKEELLVLLEKVNGDWTQRYGAEAEERRQKCRMHRHECGHSHDRESECGHIHGAEGECGHGHGHDGESGHRHGHAPMQERHPSETEENAHVEIH